MATLREYYDADFNFALRVHIALAVDSALTVEGAILYDFAGNKAFLAFYVPGEHNELELYIRLLKAIEYGGSRVTFSGNITLLSGHYAHGKIQVKKDESLQVSIQFFDDSEWISIKEIEASRRVFIYSETQLPKESVEQLKSLGKSLGHNVQFRSKGHAAERAVFEGPRAFISHDSRDKDVARKIALGLQKLICPVWYDEFSLRVGDNLRDSIEKGLKECKKCILVLSKHFFSNQGWTKKEFDSIFTREILEQTRLVLPVWLGVTKEEVYNYSPSLLMVKALDWDHQGEEDVVRRLFQVINPTQLP